MKKLLVTIGLAAVAAGAFAQGTVNTPNAAATPFRTNALAATGVYVGFQSSGNTASALGGFYYEVLTAPSTVTTVDASLQGLLAGPWSDTVLKGTNTAFAAGGRLSGPSGSAGQVQNWPASAKQSYIVVGWSANEGTTWASVSAKLLGAQFSGGKWTLGGLIPGGFVGATVIANGTTGLADGTTPYSLFGAAGAAGTPVTGPSDLFVVDIVPEPTSFALMGLGAAALLIFRRRK